MATLPKALESDQEQEKRKRTRSPAYPYVNLETAIKRAKEFYDKEARNAANIKVAVKHWGFVESSSGGGQTIAALVSFGLMQDEGIGEARKVRLTQNALRIILDTRPDSTERSELIRQAALSPKIHLQIWQKWGVDLPSDASLRHTLLLEWKPPFNDNAVDFFIREYKDTITFAKLTESDKVTSEVKNSGEDDSRSTPYVPQVGDYVQWEHNGVLGLPEATRIKGFSPDKAWAYIDGQQGALLVTELIRETAPINPRNLPDVQPLGQRNHCCQKLLCLN